ncbi:MAG: hypothetical protein ACRENP_01640 [Longimicrobiales bacterium]
MRNLLAVATLALVACDSSIEPDTIQGTYTLATINNQGMPYLIFADATGRLEVLGGRITLRPDLTFEDVLETRVVNGGTEGRFTTTDGGAYSMVGPDHALLDPADPSFASYTVTLEDGALSYTDETRLWRYRK